MAKWPCFLVVIPVGINKSISKGSRIRGKALGVPDAQHPQLYDGYPGDLDVTRFY